MDFRVLGPLEVARNGQPLALGGSKQRVVLAMLLLHANETVSTDRLIDALWGESPPSGAIRAVRVHVSRLRKVLEVERAEGGGPSVLVTTSGGYLLRVGDDEFDLARFERLLAEGREALADGVPDRASKLLARALAEWRGDPLADLAFEPFAQGEAARLEELRVVALESQIDAELQLGRHAVVEPEIERLIAEHPLRERLRALQMLALYRAGRQADALAAYRDARAVLVEEVGVEPGDELRELHGAILRQDPALAPPRLAPRPPATRAPPAPTETGRPRSRAPRRLIGAAVVVAIALGVLWVLSDDGDESTAVSENAVGVIDVDSGELRSQIDVGKGPGPSATDGQSVWIANVLDDTVSRIETGSGRLSTIDIGGEPGGIATGADFAWVSDATTGTVDQIDPEANRVVGSLEVGNGAGGVAVAFDAVWVLAAGDGEVVKIDLARGEVTTRIPVGSRPTAIVAGAGSLWVADEASGTITRVEPEAERVSEAIAVGNAPAGLAFGDGAVWVANRVDGTVSRIDPEANAVTSTVQVGAEPTGIAADGSWVWVANAGDGTVSRLSASTGQVDKTIDVGGSPHSVTIAAGAAWTTVLASRESHRGGTLRLQWEPPDDPNCHCADPIDYENLMSWDLASLTHDGLVTYRRVGGAAGSALVGNLASEVPEPSPDGKTYVFELRPDIRFSDGSPVQPEDFRSSIERFLRVNGELVNYFDHVVGARECVSEPASCDLSQGIETDARARTITVNLTSPDADFLHKLTIPAASVVPASSPPRFADRPLSGTGPYRIVSFDPEQGGRLIRNPEFEVWSPDARPDGFPDEITIDVSNDAQAQVDAVERGDADYAKVAGEFGGPLSPAGIRELAVREADRLHSTPLPETDYMFMNTTVPPFDDARVRRALNYAVDRRLVVELTGGPLLAQSTCQATPPGFPGHQQYCPFTLNPNPAGSWDAPDLARAQRLVEASGTRGSEVEVFTWPGRAHAARYFVTLLRELGYRGSLRVLPIGRYYSTIADPDSNVQMGYDGWYADYLAPSNFIGLYECSAPGNVSRYCDRRLDAQIERARAEQSADPTAAIPLWRDADRMITDAAPSVELLNRKSAVLVSDRVENVQEHPLWGVLEDQLWVE
jgi:YVTN family beta-propeller protein